MPPKKVGMDGKSGGGAAKQKKQKSQSSPGVIPRPVMAGSSSGMVVTNFEVLQTISLPTTANSVNSGVVWIHPTKLTWLNNVASSFQSYRWHHIRVGFTSSVGDSQNGVVCIGHSHDLHDTAPTNLAAIVSQTDSSVGRVSQGCISTASRDLARPMGQGIGFDLPRNRLLEIGGGKSLDYVTAPTLTAMSLDEKDHHVDLSVQWLTAMGVGAEVGFLWVSYKVELLSPTPYSFNF